jgi:hypothetical protein
MDHVNIGIPYDKNGGVKSDVGWVMLTVKPARGIVQASLFPHDLPIATYNRKRIFFGQTWESDDIMFAISGQIVPNGDAFLYEGMVTKRDRVEDGGVDFTWNLRCQRAPGLMLLDGR